MNGDEQRVREALQAILDAHGDGYQLAEHVIVMGLERVTAEGIESTAWYWAPASQALWKTSGLLETGAWMLDEHGSDID